MKILTIIGARPQFIKAAVVSRALRNQESVNEIVIHTGQHYDANMSEIFFDELDIPIPNYNLGIGGGTHGQNTGRMIENIESILQAEKPDYVLVYGDTDSTLAGALAAVKLHIPVAHVEAGLRSFNRGMPEEINRVLTDHSSSLLFPPTTTAMQNLSFEGIKGDKVIYTGDVMLDAAIFYGTKAEKYSNILKVFSLSQKAYILATLHRQENTDDFIRLSAIIQGLSTSTTPVILPLHPRTRKRISEFGITIPKSIKIIDPVGYLDMVMLEKNAKLIATDSGGVQKEAFFHRVPCITMRDETEWVELVTAGFNTLVGANEYLISREISKDRAFPSGTEAIYGNGDAGEKISITLAESK